MHTSGSSGDAPTHRWLKWLGLEEPPQDPDAWTPIVTDEYIDDLDTGVSDRASRIVEILKHAGIDAYQRAYELRDPRRLGSYEPALTGDLITGDLGIAAIDRLRVAVLVHNRDIDRAKALPELQEELNRQNQPVSDEELTRQSLEAGERPEGSSGE